MKSQLLNDFLDLCELCHDNIKIVAKIVAKYHIPLDKESRILSDFKNWTEQTRLERYGDTISHILDLPYKEVHLFVQCNNIASLLEDEEIIEEDEKEMIRIKKDKVRPHFVESLFV